MRRVGAVEVEERGSFGQRKAHPRWWWPAIGPLRGGVLAYAFGSRAEGGVVELKKVLKPLRLAHLETDAAGVYGRRLRAAAHAAGKIHTRQVEREPGTLRTRSKRRARKTPCFSTSAFRHDTVIGLFGNRSEFGTPL